MPKLIENLREKILLCAKAELLNKGYDALTVRSVARSCDIAVGTMYNYFPSKELLAAEVILSDWLAALSLMQRACLGASSVSEALRALYDGVCTFSAVYNSVWAGYSFSNTEKSAYHERHNRLVRQLADCIRPVLARFHEDIEAHYDIFLAENILVCAGNSELQFDAFLRIIHRIQS